MPLKRVSYEEGMAHIERARYAAEQHVFEIVRSMLSDIGVEMTLNEIRSSSQHNELLRTLFERAIAIAYKQRCEELGVKPIRRDRRSKYCG